MKTPSSRHSTLDGHRGYGAVMSAGRPCSSGDIEVHDSEHSGNTPV